MIKSIEVKNFQSHGHSKLELSPGVNCIVGSSDSGKTSLCRAIIWVKDNRPLGTSVIKNGTSETEVSLVVQTDKEHHIKKTRDSKNTSYECNGNEFSAVGKDVPAEVVQALGLTDLHIQKQIPDIPYLIFETPGTIASIFNAITRLDEAEGLAAYIATDIRSLGHSINVLIKLEEDTKEELDSLCWIPAFALVLEKYENTTEQIVRSEKTCKDIKETLEDISSEKDAIESLTEKLKTFNILESRLIALEEQVSTWQASYDKMLEKKESLASTIVAVVKEGEIAANTHEELERSTNILFVIDKYQDTVGLREDLEKKHQAFCDVIFNITNTNETIEKLEKTQKALQEDYQKILDEIQKLDACPYCGGVLNNETRKTLLENVK